MTITYYGNAYPYMVYNTRSGGVSIRHNVKVLDCNHHSQALEFHDSIISFSRLQFPARQDVPFHFAQLIPMPDASVF